MAPQKRPEAQGNTRKAVSTTDMIIFQTESILANGLSFTEVNIHSKTIRNHGNIRYYSRDMGQLVHFKYKRVHDYKEGLGKGLALGIRFRG